MRRRRRLAPFFVNFNFDAHPSHRQPKVVWGQNECKKKNQTKLNVNCEIPEIEMWKLKHSNDKEWKKEEEAAAGAEKKHLLNSNIICSSIKEVKNSTSTPAASVQMNCGVALRGVEGLSKLLTRHTTTSS